MPWKINDKKFRLTKTRRYKRKYYTWGGDDEITAVFKGNQCIIGIADSPYDYRGEWICSYSISNNKITITVKQEIFADGNNGCVIKYFIYKDNKLVVYTDSVELCELEKFISSNPWLNQLINIWKTVGSETFLPTVFNFSKRDHIGGEDGHHPPNHAILLTIRLRSSKHILYAYIKPVHFIRLRIKIPWVTQYDFRKKQLSISTVSWKDYEDWFRMINFEVENGPGVPDR